MKETGELFARGKLQAACLSQWQMHQWALGLLPQSQQERSAEHARVCLACRTRHAMLTAEREAASVAPIPPALIREAMRPAHGWQERPQQLAMAGAMAMMVVGSVLLFQRAHDEVQLGVKGAPQAQLAVMRDGRVIEGPWQTVQPFAPGDKVRLRIATTPKATWQVLWTRDGEDPWVQVWAGMVPAADWMPAALAITSGTLTHVRAVVCDVQPATTLAPGVVPSGCQSHDFSF